MVLARLVKAGPMVPEKPREPEVKEELWQRWQQVEEGGERQ